MNTTANKPRPGAAEQAYSRAWRNRWTGSEQDPISRSRKLTTLIATTVTAAGAVIFLISNWPLILSMVRRNQLGLPAMLIVVVSSLIFRAMAFRQCVTGSNVSLSVAEAVHLFSVSNAISNVAFPGLGFVYRGAYLRKHQQLPVTAYVVASSSVEIVGMILWVIFGMAAAAAMVSSALESKSLAVATMCAVSVLTAAAGGTFAEKNGDTASAGTQTFRGAKLKDLLIISFLLSASAAVQCSCFYAGFQGFGFNIPVSSFVVILSCYQLGAVIAITPGGAGVQELVAILVSRSLQLPLHQIAASFLLLRLLRITCAILLGLISYAWLAKRTRTSQIPARQTGRPSTQPGPGPAVGEGPRR